MQEKEFLLAVENRRFPLEFPGHFVAGRWHQFPKSKILKESHNPNDGQLITQVRFDKGIVTQAIEAAHAAKDSFARIHFADRIEVLRRIRQVMGDYQAAIVDALRIEAGKPRWEAELEFDASIRFLDDATRDPAGLESALVAPAKLAAPASSIFLTPVGVTAGFLPFSTPLTSLVYSLVGAVGSGSPLVLVASAHAVLMATVMSYIAQNVGLADGALNIIFGNFEVYKQTISDKRVRGILYTGSREHCEVIRRETQAMYGRQVILQSGGKNAVIVHETADAERAAKMIGQGAFRSAGQLCSSTSRVFVPQTKLKALSDALLAYIDTMTIGRTDMNADGAGPMMGPLYSKKAVDKFLRFQTMAHRESENDLSFGRSLEVDGDGYFVRPGIHIMQNVDQASAFQANVLFCPDICVYAYDTWEHAIAGANATDAPLVTSVIGDEGALQDVHSLIAPNVFINHPTVESDATLPLAGNLQCGIHRYSGTALIMLLSYPQVVVKG